MQRKENPTFRGVSSCKTCVLVLYFLLGMLGSDQKLAMNFNKNPTLQELTEPRSSLIGQLPL